MTEVEELTKSVKELTERVNALLERLEKKSNFEPEKKTGEDSALFKRD